MKGGEVTRTQLLRFCDINNYALTSQELEVLFRRLDRNEDGLITYNDFVKEMVVV